MPQPINDNSPCRLSADADFIIREILEQMAPTRPDDYDRIAAECDKGAGAFDGGPALAHEVATELRRRANALRRGVV